MGIRNWFTRRKGAKQAALPAPQEQRELHVIVVHSTSDGWMPVASYAGTDMEQILTGSTWAYACMEANAEAIAQLQQIENLADAPPDLVRRIFDHAGSLEGYRTYKNNVLFLVADEDQVENMVQVAQRYLAIGRIVGDAERLREFHQEQRKRLKKMAEAAELDVRVAITKAYKYLYYPSADAPQRYSNLARETLPPQDQGEVNRDQTNVVLRVLKQLQKVLQSSEYAPRAKVYMALALHKEGDNDSALSYLSQVDIESLPEKERELAQALKDKLEG